MRGFRQLGVPIFWGRPVAGPQSHPWATDAPQKQDFNPYPYDAKGPLKATLRGKNSLLFIERKSLSP
jgi:hypothetical protein